MIYNSMGTKLDFSKISNLPLQEAIREPIASSSAAQRLSKLVSGDTLAFTALTFGDLVYDAIRIDPLIIEGIDFARKSDLSETINFAEFAQSILEKPTESLIGDISQMQGYVAERLVAQTIRAQGAEVQFPDTPNQAGYDLLVNGDPFQVKCLSSPEGVYQHLEKYPDIPIFVNDDLAPHFAGDERVFPIEGLKHDEVVSATTDALGHGADVLDFNIPLIISALVSAKNAHALLCQQTDIRSAVENIGLDISVRVTSSATAASITSLALWGVGITSGYLTVILPIFGASAGHEVGRKISTWIKSEVLSHHEKTSLQSALVFYLSEASIVIQRMINISSTEQTRLQDFCTTSSDSERVLLRDWIKRMSDENKARKVQLRKLEQGIQNNGLLDECDDSILISTAQALLVSQRAGLLPINIISPRKNLISAAIKYRKALERRVL
jgi:hypothetical protein